MKIRFILVPVLLLAALGIFVYMYQGQDGYAYIAKDSKIKIYFEKESVKKWIDEETQSEIIDVFIKREYINPIGAVKWDRTLWHIDQEHSRYRASDTCAYDIDDKPLET